MATNSQSDDPIEILENVPVKAGKYGKCHKCISESRKTGDTDKGRYLYNIILHNKLTGTITAELRCRDCDCIQQNPLTTIVEHSYIARSAAETSCHQLSANNYSLQLNVNNLNNMCAMLQQRADKYVYDYTHLLNSYNAGQQINTEINARNKYLEENYAKAQTGINDMKSELAMLQASNINVVDRLKTEHTDICQKYIKTIEEQNTMIANLNTTITNQNTTITNQNTTIEDLNTAITNQDNSQKYIKTIADLNKKITDYDTKIVDLNTKIANLNKKIVDQDKKVADLNRDNMKYEEVNNRFKLQISEFEHINTDLKEQINTLVGAVRDLKPQNKSLEQSNKDLKTQIAALKKNKQTQNTGQAENAEQHAKIVQTYESELTILRGKLTEMIEENKKMSEEKKKMKQTQRDRCLEIIKNNEIILKATKQQADEFKTNIEKKYFEKELEIAKKYEQMLKECGVDETYKHTINTKYKAKLLLLTHFKQDQSFGNIQPYTSDTTRVTTGS
jgi:chromosome segregation ATPase